MKTILKLATTILLSANLFTTSAYADWILDNTKSALYFASIKKQSVAEIHQFKQLDGTIDKSGQGNLTIDLASVETNVAIRNQRLRETLFETQQFPKAIIGIDLRQTGIRSGIQTITVTLDLHGVKKEIPATIAVVASEKQVYIATVAPIILNAADFGLEGGLTVLREIASLDSISNAVPVTFFLNFKEISPAS